MDGRTFKRLWSQLSEAATNVVSETQIFNTKDVVVNSEFLTYLSWEIELVKNTFGAPYKDALTRFLDRKEFHGSLVFPTTF